MHDAYTTHMHNRDRKVDGQAAQRPEGRERLESGASLALLRPAAAILGLMVLLTGLAYPLAMTGIAGLVFPRQATASLIERDGVVIGTALVAQGFESPAWFHPRPSDTGWDAADSGASNFGPSNAELIATVRERAEAWRALNGGEVVPVDAVTGSGSGLDPHISVANAMGQAARVAEARAMPEAEVRALVEAGTEGPWLGIFGEPRVNVLLLNLALDEAAPAAPVPSGEVPSE
jgi:potassium-transporting ATPase KdpC subunit